MQTQALLPSGSASTTNAGARSSLTSVPIALVPVLVAAAAHAPFISSASNDMFGLESFTDMGKPRDMAKVFDTVEYAKWKSFRESEDSRYVGLTLPRFLGRLPYDPKEGTTVEGFNYVEDVSGTDHDKYLWCNTAYAFGARLTKA